MSIIESAVGRKGGCRRAVVVTCQGAEFNLSGRVFPQRVQNIADPGCGETGRGLDDEAKHNLRGIVMRSQLRAQTAMPPLSSRYAALRAMGKIRERVSDECPVIILHARFIEPGIGASRQVDLRDIHSHRWCGANFIHFVDEVTGPHAPGRGCSIMWNLMWSVNISQRGLLLRALARRSQCNSSSSGREGRETVAFLK